MRNETRQKFNEFTGQVAKLNAITSAMVQFNVQPSVQQTLETKMQESVAFLSMINMVPVDELKGQKVGIGISSTIAGRTDTATNVCPSIHVFNSVTLLLAYYRSRIFDAPRRRWMRPAAAVLCISIVCSTVLLKQHSCIDAALGALLALALDTAFSRMMDTNDLPQMRRI